MSVKQQRMKEKMPFKFVDTYREIAHPGTNAGLHRHPYYEILYCHSAAPVEYLVDTERYVLNRGDVLYIPPGIKHQPIFGADSPMPQKWDVLHVSTEFIDYAMHIFPNMIIEGSAPIPPLHTAGTRWSFISEYFQFGLLEAEIKTPGWESAVFGNTMIILSNLKRIHMSQCTKSVKIDKADLMERVLAYVEEHYTERITLGEIAQHCYVSESTIHRLFKQKMNTSFSSFITNKRLATAKYLITEGESLEAVSARVGFSDYSVFYRAFKNRFGNTPRQYRKDIKGRNDT